MIYPDSLGDTMSLTAEAMIVASADEKIQAVSGSLCRVLGYTREELVGAPLAGIFAGPLPPDLAAFQGAVADQDNGAASAVRCRARDGRLVPLVISRAPLTDVAGNVTGSVCIARFQTYCKCIEHECDKRQASTRELLDRMSCGVAVYEAVNNGGDFIIKYFNRAGEWIDQVRKEEIMGRRVLDVFPRIESCGLLEVIRRVWRTGVSEEFPAFSYGAGSRTSWRQNYIYKLTSGEVVSVFEDITERKEAEDNLRKSEQNIRGLVENSLVGILLIQEGRIVYQNPEQKRLFGTLPRDFKVTDYEGIHPDDVAKVRDAYEKIQAKQVQCLDMDFRFFQEGKVGRRSNMKWVYCRVRGFEYQGRDTIQVSMVDMSSAKELERLLRIQDKMSSLGRVAAGIAHEIRNPLSGINIYLSTLEKIYDKQEHHGKVRDILMQLHSASNKIESVIKRVMDFSKPSEPRFALMTINRPVEDAIKLIAVTLRKSRIQVQKQLAADLGSCYLDPQLIEQVMLNLLNNAAEALKSHGGEKKIGISTGSNKERILVRVFDSGPGIADDKREKIFDPFYTTKSDGTGIGLSICQRIIVDHGGFIRVARSQWEGAEFIIELPRERRKLPR